ncbi:HNH endonuclease [Vibrio crassostreae]|nr:HNH endonuclease [Vibrio crassostreae]CAK2511768.1 HNH endonuclease [Vibrio crassostreae]CAK2515725.1 HNH endonuclease [Vibrio crassostreae]CAK2896221.1 HNH endonuclease [Vibrio crassostreae]CAK2916754.1 HNH endonuclease [Vibrio crassostreae]
MASKNPIKGYIACPTHGCDEICTVHAVGEHKLIEGGEPPKNKRRLGQLYTICPSCKTNQSAGKPFQDWLHNHMVSTPEKATTGYKNSVDEEPHPTKPQKPNETKPDKGSSNPDKPNDNQPAPVTTRLGWSFLLLLSTCALLWFGLTKTKKGVTHEQ